MHKLPTWTREEWLEAIARMRARQERDEPLTAETRRLLALTSTPRDYSAPATPLADVARRKAKTVRIIAKREPWETGSAALPDPTRRKAGKRAATRADMTEWWLAPDGSA